MKYGLPYSLMFNDCEMCLSCYVMIATLFNMHVNGFLWFVAEKKNNIWNTIFQGSVDFERCLRSLWVPRDLQDIPAASQNRFVFSWMFQGFGSSLFKSNECFKDSATELGTLTYYVCEFGAETHTVHRFLTAHVRIRVAFTRVENSLLKQ